MFGKPFLCGCRKLVGCRGACYMCLCLCIHVYAHMREVRMSHLEMRVTFWHDCGKKKRMEIRNVNIYIGRRMKVISEFGKI